MSFRTNKRGESAGVRRNLLRYAYRTYKISLSPFRSYLPRLYRNDILRVSSGLSVFRTFGLLTLLALMCSCSFNPNLQGKGENYIQGVWQQDSSAVQLKLITASNYHIKFDCDSFYLQINNISRVKTGTDTCIKNGRYAEYVRGTYYHRHDTLLLKGQFCNPDYSLKATADCFRAGPYDEFFKVGKKSDTLIELSGTSNVIPINLHRTKQTVCIPKPL